MLQNIAERGTLRQKETAVQSMLTSAQIRGQRQERSSFDVLVETAVATGLERAVYTANFGTSLPGQLVRGENGPPSGDAAVDEAYDGAGTTYELYQTVYGRQSIDNNGLHLISTVHYQQGYDNAFWNGQQMVYGDGDEDLPPDQRLFNRFTIALDVIGHELAHGVTQFEANLTYYNQSGALNESFSDVFGALVKQYRLNQTAGQADWLIGAGLFTENVNGVALRSMAAPGTAYDDPVLGKDPQPAHMDDYQNVTYDNGGVHINSGIPNHAFYLTALEMGGYAWEKAGRIWYETLCNRLPPNADFQKAAQETFAAAGALYGVDSPEQLAVRHGWEGVGLSVDDGSTPPPIPVPEPPGCGAALATMVRSILGTKGNS